MHCWETLQYVKVNILIADIPECRDDTCAVVGECLEKVGGGTLCLCPPGLTGSRCEVDVDECVPNPCRHDGECTESKDVINEFECSCTPQWTGKTCTQSISMTLQPYIALY